MPACLQRTAAEGEYPFVRVDGLLLVAGTMTVCAACGAGCIGIRSNGYREICYVGRALPLAQDPGIERSLFIVSGNHGGLTQVTGKIERAVYESLAFRCTACNWHPSHGTLANFRKRFGRRGAFESAFAQVLQVARDSRRSSFGAGESEWD